MSELTVASQETQKLLPKSNLKVRTKCQKTICKCHTTKPVWKKFIEEIVSPSDYKMFKWLFLFREDIIGKESTGQGI